jgi:hypothetical protein
MVSSIAIGLGFSTWRASAETGVLSKIDAFGLRGVVVAAVASCAEPPAHPGSPRGRVEPTSLDQVLPWHFIR